MEKKSNIQNRTYDFSLKVIVLLESLPKSYIYQTLGRQLLRSATSIGANIIEAQAGSSKKDFTNYYHIALKSANETKYWLRMLYDLTTEEKAGNLIKETEEICRILGASLLTLKGKRNK